MKKTGTVDETCRDCSGRGCGRCNGGTVTWEVYETGD